METQESNIRISVTPLDRWVQVVTAAAILFGLGLVVWELQQTRSLAHTVLIHGTIDALQQDKYSLYGEELSDVLTTACFEPDRINRSQSFVLNAYFQVRMTMVQRYKTSSTAGGFDTDWRVFGGPHIREILAFPQGRAWLEDLVEPMGAFDPEFTDFIAASFGQKNRTCAERINAIVGKNAA